jgi:membrane protease YdiL (CAAX protease family)
MKRYPVALYFALAFAVAWLGILLVLGPDGIRGGGSLAVGVAALVFLAMIAGPSSAGIVLTGILEGGAGLRRLGGRIGRWRVGLRWYAALLIAPLLGTAVLVPLALFSPVFIPGIVTAEDKLAHLGFGLVAGIVAGFFEELGWTGFAVPRLRLRRSALATGVIVGVLWGSWHFLADQWGNWSTYGALYLPHFLLVWIGGLTAFRVLMVWVYDHTESLLLAQLMHASFTGGLVILSPQAASVADNMLWHALFVAALWVVVAVVVRVEGQRLARRPLQAQPA